MYQSTSNSRHQERGIHDIRLQDVFLNFCRREKVLVNLHFVDQSARSGRIIGFDYHSIIVESNGRQLLVYKSGVTAIDPQEGFDYIFNDQHRFENPRATAEGLPENFDFSDVMV
ncbi:MAG: RNA chaperone Hfq [Eubacteriales bacterium]|nr:RNA chaperone Hfq [Eubacteriales bacterium]